MFGHLGVESFRDKGKVLRAAPVVAALGALGRPFYDGTLDEQLTAKTSPGSSPAWPSAGERWNGLAGKITPSGAFSVGSGKEGYAIAADHWGHGLATDAAQTMITFAFRVLGLHRITAAIGPDNAPSIAVVKRLGFTREGRLRDHVFTSGAWRDSELYSILTHEWKAA